MPDGEEKQDLQIKPFGAWLQEQRNGSLHRELGEALAEISQQVEALNKPGKLTLTISVKPAGTAQHMVIVADTIKADVPQPDRPTSMFFTDEAGNLSRRDPRQAELPLKSVDGGEGDVKPLRKAGEQS